MIEIPAGIVDSALLFDAFAKTENFPGYLGENWNSLYDLLCEFSRIRATNITINHSDVPLAEGSEDRKNYLEVLSSAVSSWKKDSRGIYFDSDGRINNLNRSVSVCFPRCGWASCMSE